MGVSPDSTVDGLASTGVKLPLFFRAPKKAMPGLMSSKDPPLASAAANTAEKAAFALVGSPLSATLPLYAGSLRSAKDAGHLVILAESQPIEIYPPYSLNH